MFNTTRAPRCSRLVVLFLIGLAATSAGTPDNLDDLFLLSAGGPFAFITLVLGFAVFLVAMWFDMSDPHRVTRRSANGFWLHVVAAPALVNTIALTLLDRDTAGSNILLVAVLAFFALVAIVIDRRSFLLAAIGYSVALAFTVLGGPWRNINVRGIEDRPHVPDALIRVNAARPPNGPIAAPQGGAPAAAPAPAAPAAPAQAAAPRRSARIAARGAP